MKDFHQAKALCGPERNPLTRVGLALAVALGAWFAVACGQEETRKPHVPHPGNGGEGGADMGLGGAGSGGSGSKPTCEDGTQKECTVYVQQASGVTSCWKGVKFCVDGKFTECLEAGTVFPTAGAE